MLLPHCKPIWILLDILIYIVKFSIRFQNLVIETFLKDACCAAAVVDLIFEAGHIVAKGISRWLSDKQQCVKMVGHDDILEQLYLIAYFVAIENRVCHNAPDFGPFYIGMPLLALGNPAVAGNLSEEGCTVAHGHGDYVDCP